MDSKVVFDNERVVATLIGSRLEIIWSVPTEAHALKESEGRMSSEVERMLAALRTAVEDRAPGSMSLLVVIRGVNKRYADIMSLAIEWLRSFRQIFTLCVFATPNPRMRSSIKVLGLLPGIELKGFESEDEARRFMEERGA